MRVIKNLEVEVVDENIWEVPIEQIAEICFEFNLKTISYEETERGALLVAILVRTGDRVLDDGTFISRTLITNVLYAFVSGYKRLLFWDGVNDVAQAYTDGNAIHRYETTHSFAVTRYPHFLVKEAVKHILRKLEAKKQ